jgi:hypothetical protein
MKWFINEPLGDLMGHIRTITCPFCGVTFEENCEYVDIGIGYIQCSPNVCPNCKSREIGELKYDNLDEEEKEVCWKKGGKEANSQKDE